MTITQDDRLRIRDYLNTFAHLNQYSSSLNFNETAFLLILSYYCISGSSISSSKITSVLKKGNTVRQSDRNKTWLTAKQLVDKGCIYKPKRGYYLMTLKGQDEARNIIKQMNKRSKALKLSYY